MNPRVFLACAAAALALAGCNKDKGQASGSAAPESDVKITMASPPPGGTWADVANATTDGIMMGNPNAKVKLVEIGSLFCPVCKRFEEEGVPTLINKYVKSGDVSWEFRPYLIHGAVDMAANLVARCNGPKTFFPLSQALYADQEKLLSAVQGAPQEKVTQIQNLPTNQVFVEMAKLMGLQDWAAARGVPVAKSNQCLSNEQMINREVEITSNVNSQYPEFKGTPSFILNGSLLPETSNWATLQPKLDAALK
ncbi:MAG TPA: thioredoxin domain-containing protein [Sphingomicrobium sp.]|jgi:protein-disulfide isomerase